MTGDEVVGIQVKDRSNPIVSGFLPASQHAEPQWWLESSSYPIKINDHQRVRVLITSEEMERKHGSSAILITFDCGKGNVIHMVSHFYLQRSETRGARHKMSSTQFAIDMNASEDILREAQEKRNINYAQVQSTATSSAFIYNQISSRLKSNSRKD